MFYSLCNSPIALICLGLGLVVLVVLVVLVGPVGLVVLVGRLVVRLALLLDLHRSSFDLLLDVSWRSILQNVTQFFRKRCVFLTLSSVVVARRTRLNGDSLGRNSKLPQESPM